MPRQSNHRTAIIRAAVALFRSKGFAATGLNEILALAKAPKGSLYHYFPGGKEDIAVAAVQAGGAEIAQALERLYANGLTGAQMLETTVAFLGKGLTASDYRQGCPVATVLLETAPCMQRVAAAGKEAFGAWRALIAAALERDGFEAARAAQLALLAVATLEGGLILARAESSAQPLGHAISAILPLLRREGASARG